MFAVALVKADGVNNTRLTFHGNETASSTALQFLPSIALMAGRRSQSFSFGRDTPESIF